MTATTGFRSEYSGTKDDGPDAVHDLSTRAKPFFKLIPFAELRPGREAPYLVEGLIPRVGLTVIWGRQKCGKTFWTVDLLLMHVALGRKYRGRRVKQGPVVYVILEGVSGARRRAEALRRHDPAADTAPFYVIEARLNLVADHTALIRDIQAQIGEAMLAAVTIDTLNRSLAGSESSDRDMGSYIQAADAVREAFNCAVILLHHCGIDDSRSRGHTSLPGAVDAEIEVKRDAVDHVVVTVRNMRDGPTGDQIISRLKEADAGFDEDGLPVTSCIVEPVEGESTVSLKTTEPRLKKSSHTALRALWETVDKVGAVPPASNHIPPATRTVTTDQWRRHAYARGISTGGTRARQQAFKRSSEDLIEDQHVGVWRDQVWPITKEHNT